MMNRKAEGPFSITMTTIPIMIILVVLMGLFIFAAYLESRSKPGINSDALGIQISEDSLLFKQIQVDAQQMPLAEGLIKYPYEKVPTGLSSLQDRSAFTKSYIDALLSFVKSQTLPSSTLSWESGECFSIAIEDFTNGIGRFAVINKDSKGIVSTEKDEMYKIDSKTKSGSKKNVVITTGDTSHSDTFGYNYIPLTINGNSGAILYYFVRCSG